MVDVYYVKANREEWKTPDIESGRPTDWDNFPIGRIQWFATYTKNKIYWKNLKKGDIIVGHSVYISSTRKGKPTYSPLARISAIAIVEEPEHIDKNGNEIVLLKKVIGFNPVIIPKEKLKAAGLIGEPSNEQNTAEPYRSGINRQTITKITTVEYKKIIKLIKEQNPDIELELRKHKLLIE